MILVVEILALVVFGATTMAIFSRHFHDGIVAKHFMVGSAISSAVVFLDPCNHKAAIASAIFLALGLLWWYCRNYTKLRFTQRTN